MSQTDALLKSLSNDEISTYLVDPSNEEHIVVTAEREVIVPDSLKRIAVQYDHNIETVTFDCPRYWDEHDMSQMVVYINYACPSGAVGSCLTSNVRVDDYDSTIMHFEWTISENVTFEEGFITFLVCVKNVDEDGVKKNHWNSQLCKDMYVSEGLELPEDFVQANPDILTQILLFHSDILELNAITLDRAAVYVGSGDMPEWANVQIDPQGEATIDAGSGGEVSGTGIQSVKQTTTSTEDGGINVVTVTLTNGTKSTFQIRNGNKGSDGEKGKDGVGIQSIRQTTTSTADGGVNIITATLTDGSTSEFQIRNGSKGSSGASGDGSGSGNGIGIESVEQTTTSSEDGGTNVVTVTLTDGSTSEFTVKNGSKGSDGESGSDGNGIESVEQTTISNEDDGINEITVRLTDGSESAFQVKNGSKGSDGANGAAGKDGEDGVGIQSVEQTTTSTADGGTNVITVTLTDGSTSEIQIKNGSKGSPGASGDGTGEQVAEIYIGSGEMPDWAKVQINPEGEASGILTEADKQDIVNQVIESLPDNGGGSGESGADGEDGVGIQSIEQTTTSNVDGGTNVVTVTLTNGNTSTFQVKNGSKGSKGDTGDNGLGTTTEEWTFTLEDGSTVTKKVVLA